MTATFALVSCDNKSPKATMYYDGYSRTNDGDTINRITEKGKQGLWVYKKADGSHTDTLYKDGVPQLNK